MSAAVWNEPQAQELGRRDARRLVGGGSWYASVLIVVRPPHRPAGEGIARAGDPSPAETA
jgi:hypothetical protein